MLAVDAAAQFVVDFANFLGPGPPYNFNLTLKILRNVQFFTKIPILNFSLPIFLYSALSNFNS